MTKRKCLTKNKKLANLYFDGSQLLNQREMPNFASMSNSNIMQGIGQMKGFGNMGKGDNSSAINSAVGDSVMATGAILSMIDNARTKPINIYDRIGLSNAFAMGGDMAGDMMSTATALIGNAINQAKIEDTNSLRGAINDYGNTQINASSYDDLLSNWSNRTELQDITGRDLRNKSVFGDFSNSLITSGMGFKTGSKAGPAGAIAGGIIGGVSSVLGSVIGRIKANKEAKSINRLSRAMNERNLTSYENKTDALESQNDLNVFSNFGVKAAYGGPIHIKKENEGAFTDYCGGNVTQACINRGKNSPNALTRKRATFADNARKWHDLGGPLFTNGANWSNGLTIIGNGNTHENNPYEGVQVGVDNQGIPNLVEEGEVVWNDYVFSNRLKPNEEVKKKYKLKGNTFADAVKYLQKESEERPNDPISKRSLDTMLAKLANEQELIRQAKEGLEEVNYAAKGGPIQSLVNKSNKALAERGPIDYSYLFKGGNYGGGEFGGAGAGLNGFIEEPQYETVKDTLYIPIQRTFNEAFAEAKKDTINPTFMFNGKEYTKKTGPNPENVRAGNRRTEIIGVLPFEYEKQVEKKAYGGLLNKFEDGGKKRKLNTYSNFTKLNDDSFYTKDYMKFWNWINKNRSNPVAKEWLNRINKGEFGEIGGNTFNTDDILRLSHDYKRGPVHNAMLAASKAYNKLSYNPNEGVFSPDNIGLAGISLDSPINAEDTFGAEITANNYLNDELMKLEERYSPKTRKPEIKNLPVFEETVNDYPLPVSTKLSKHKIPNSWLRYAPVLGSAIGLGMALKKPDYSNADRIGSLASNVRGVEFEPIGNYLAYKPFDRNYYINKAAAQNAATRRAIRDSNNSAANAAILASDYNYITGLGSLARQAEEYNLAQRQKVEEFNRGTNMYNSEGLMKAAIANMEADKVKNNYLMAAANMREDIAQGRRNSIYGNLTGLFNNLGAVGTDNVNRKFMNMLIDSGAVKAPNTAAKGGKLKRKKKGLTY